MNILFVCTGNTCRSPMAAALCHLRHPGLSVRSCGLSPHIGAAVSPHAAVVMTEYGTDLTGHKAKALTPELLAWAERIYLMTGAALQAVALRYPEAADKLSLLPGGEVPDPYGGSIEDYRRTAAVLDCAIVRLFPAPDSAAEPPGCQS